MRPFAGRSSPAIAASVVLFPEPDGPKRIVIPGGTSSSTSSVKPARTSCTFTESAVSGGIALRRELVDRVEKERCHRSEHHDGREGVALAMTLDGIVD